MKFVLKGSNVLLRCVLLFSSVLRSMVTPEKKRTKDPASYSSVSAEGTDFEYASIEHNIGPDDRFAYMQKKKLKTCLFVKGAHISPIYASHVLRVALMGLFPHPQMANM